MPWVASEPQLQPREGRSGRPARAPSGPPRWSARTAQQAHLGERDAHRQETFIARQLALADPAGVGEPLAVLGEDGLGRGRRIVAVGEHSPDARIAQTLEGAIGVLGGVVAMGEVEDRRDARFERFECADVVAGVDVLGGAVRRDGHAACPAEVVLERPVRADAAKGRLPCVPVGVDEARHDDMPGDVDHLGVPGVDPWGDGRDRASSISTSPAAISPMAGSMLRTIRRATAAGQPSRSPLRISRGTLERRVRRCQARSGAGPRPAAHASARASRPSMYRALPAM